MFQPTSTYHIYNRANGHENLFREEKNYYYFLEKYYNYIFPVADTMAWCLLANHFHAMIRIRKEAALNSLETFQDFKRKTSQKFQGFEIKTSQKFGAFEKLNNIDETIISKFISRQFGSLFSCYAQSYNKVYGRTGSLFQPNVKKKLVNSDAYFTQLILYIHNNPVKHGFVKNLYDWPYSSLHIYSDHLSKLLEGLQQSKDPMLLEKMTSTKQEVLDWFGGYERFKKAHMNMVDIKSLFD